MLLFVYNTTRKRFVIFTCRYFNLSWNTAALSQSNWRNFSCSSRKQVIHVVLISNCWQRVLSIFIGTYLMNRLLESLDPLSSFDLSCSIKCNFMWDGFGRWLGRNWKSFLRRKLNYSCMVCSKVLSFFFFIIPEKPLRINNRNKYVFMCYYYYRNALALVVVVPTLHQESEPWPTAKGPLG